MYPRFFEGYDPTREQQRPGGRKDSLFDWVISRPPSMGIDNGWLFLTDGSGEVADFLNIEVGETCSTITLIHIKAVRSARKHSAEVAATPFEVVCSQLNKNMMTLCLAGLAERLAVPGASVSKGEPWRNLELKWFPSWGPGSAANQGKPKSPMDILSSLRPESVRFRVMIVQPDLQLSTIQAANRGTTPIAGVRWEQLKLMLWGCDRGADAVGAQFSCIVRDDG